MPLLTLPSGLGVHYIRPTSPDSTPVFRPSAPTVLFLHPLFLDAHFFAPQFRDARLASSYNLLAIDLHYHGETKPPVDDKPFDLTQCAKDIIATLEALQLPGVHVFGSCLGASVATQICLLNPSLVLSLTLCGNDAFVESPENLEQYRFLRDACLAPADDGQDQLASDVVKGIHWMLFGDNPSAIPLIEEWVVTTRLRPSNGPLVNKLFSTLLDRRRLDLELFATVKCPVLILHGDQDSTCPPEVAQALDDAFLNAWRQLCIVPGAPHYLSWTHPHEVNNVAADFLDKLTGTDSTEDVLRPRKGSASYTLPFPYPDVTIKRKTSVAAGMC